jgi:hypothetical protein
MMEFSPPPTDAPAPPEKTLDTKTIEVMSLAVFRTIFGEGVHVPLQKQGMMDMDLVIRDSNVLLNMNQVMMHVPELVLWRFTFAFRGKPVVEYGRGIKNDVKFHFPQLFFLMVTIWQNKRRMARERAQADAAKARDMLTMSLTDPRTGKIEEIPV